MSRKQSHHAITTTISLLGLLLLLPNRASAYTDPGSGALLLQTLAAGFTGLAFYFRRFLMRLLYICKRDRQI
jgi:hypothetical protein